MTLRPDPTPERLRRAAERRAASEKRYRENRRERLREKLAAGERIGLAPSTEPIKPNAKRKAESFDRNFLSVEYVRFTKASPCLFCNGGPCVTAHLIEGRKMGGRGGDWRATGPVCFECDTAWSGGRLTFLASKGLTLDDLPAMVARHHERWALSPHYVEES